jgi:hypothetical protein
MKKYFIIFSIIIFSPFYLVSQTIFEPITNNRIYEFLDELANNHIIIINSTVKPFSRNYIYDKLQEAEKNNIQLSERQKDELQFYLNGFLMENPSIVNEKYDIFSKNENLSTSISTLSLIYKDTFLRVSVKPIWGISYFKTESENIRHTWGGAEFMGYIGKNWSLYASLRDNNETKVITRSGFLNQNSGAPQKYNSSGGGDYSEMRGGIIYSWKWGSFGLIKDHFIWGDNYNGSNIFSGRTPSFAHIKLSLKPAKWFEFNYIHGWLNSEVIDSNRSYNSGSSFRTVFRDKYIAANLFTFTPFKRLNVSVGNSIVYSDVSIQAAYLIPVLFYKSVDHTLNSTYQYGDAGQNSQMFMSISSRQIKNINIFTSLYIDELSLKNMFDNQKHSNFLSFKIGGSVTDFYFKNITIIAEYTRTNPMAYQHFLPATTFENNHFSLGHYLKDNAQEVYLSAIYKPIRGMSLQASWTQAKKGNIYQYGDIGIFGGLPFIKDVIWENNTLALKATYELFLNTILFVEAINSNIKGYAVDGKSEQYYLDLFTPKSFQGNQIIVNTGLAIGF